MPRRSGGALLLGVALIMMLAVPVTVHAAEPKFTDVRDAAGVGDDFYNGLTDHALGINWIDYNRDTWADLFVTNGKGSRPHLFRNNGDGTFARVDALLGDLPDVEMMGAVFGDVDNDGDDDIYVHTDYPNVGPRFRGGPPHLLLENQWADNGGREIPGKPLFVDVAAAAGVDDLLPAPGADGPAYRTPSGALLDYDRDGHLDIFVCHWLGSSEGKEGDPDLRERLFRNKGDGTFEDTTASSGLDLGDDPTTRRPCLAAIAAHLDDDLWPDIWVGNIHLPLPYKLDRVLQNQGEDGSSCADGHCFIDRALDSPDVGDDDCVAMGVTVGDVELDGDWDVYISDLYNYESCDPTPTELGNPLYLGTGNDIIFQDNTAGPAGVLASNSWGVLFFDVDHDGYEDIHVAATGETRADHLYYNLRNGTFDDIASSAGFFFSKGDSRGSAVADFDHDGDLDLAVVNQLGPLQLFENQTTGAGHWLQVRLVATESNRSAIGTIVRVTAGSKQLKRQVLGGVSAHSQNELAVHFGLGDATVVDHLQVLWPSGLVSDRFDQPVDSFLTIVEDGAGNQPPAVTITAPISETKVDEGALVTLAGIAADAEEGDLSAALTWTSDVDGVIGSGAAPSTSTLSKGTHRITAEVTDSGGMSGAYTTTVHVGSATPVVAIDSPADGSTLYEGSTIEFTASATDLEDGDLGASLSWESDLDGALGTGGTLSTTLSPGTHMIAASVTDSAGLSAFDSISLTVEAGTTVYPAGTKLVVTKKKTGLVNLSVLAKDPATLANEPCEVDGELVIECIGAGTPAQTFPLPASLWKPIKAKKPELGCKYGPDDVVKKILLKRGKMLKVTAGAPDLVSLTSDPRPVRIELRHGEARHCLEFGGARASLKPGKKLQATQAGPATACPDEG